MVLTCLRTCTRAAPKRAPPRSPACSACSTAPCSSAACPRWRATRWHRRRRGGRTNTFTTMPRTLQARSRLFCAALLGGRASACMLPGEAGGRDRWVSSPSHAVLFLVHPAADQGHQALAELTAHVLRTAARNVNAAGGPGAVLRASGAAERLQQDVPPPMIPGNADAATTVCAMQVRPERCAVGLGIGGWRPEYRKYANLSAVAEYCNVSHPIAPSRAGGLQGRGGGHGGL